MEESARAATEEPLSGPPPYTPLIAENATELWSRALAQVPGLAGEHAKHFANVAISAPNRLEIRFRSAYTFSKSVCERPDQKAKFEQALAALTGQRIQVEFKLLEEHADKEAVAASRPIPPHQRMAQTARHPMVRRASELFGAHPTRVEDPPEAKPQ